MTRRLVLGALLAASALVALVGGARAATPKPPTLELVVIHATQSGPQGSAGAIDKELHDLQLHMKEKPFVNFNTFKQHDRKLLPLDKPISYSLANGRTLVVNLTNVLVPDAGAGDGGVGEKRYQLETQISEPADGGKANVLKGHVTVSGNEPFWIAGQGFQGGTLVLELVVRP
jgi:hypothetical protein